MCIRDRICYVIYLKAHVSSNLSNQTFEAPPHDETPILTTLRNVEPSRIGMINIGEAMGMRSVATQTNKLFDFEELVSVPLCIMKKLLIEQRYDKKVQQYTPSFIQELTNNTSNPWSLLVTSTTEKNIENITACSSDIPVGQASLVAVEEHSNSNAIDSSSARASHSIPRLKIETKNIDKCPSTAPLNVVGICKACGGDKESKHVHYGGKCCHSCRAFFRRMSKTFAR